MIEPIDTEQSQEQSGYPQQPTSTNFQPFTKGVAHFFRNDARIQHQNYINNPSSHHSPPPSQKQHNRSIYQFQHDRQLPPTPNPNSQDQKWNQDQQQHPRPTLPWLVRRKLTTTSRPSFSSPDPTSTPPDQATSPGPGPGSGEGEKRNFDLSSLKISNLLTRNRTAGGVGGGNPIKSTSPLSSLLEEEEGIDKASSPVVARALFQSLSKSRSSRNGNGRNRLSTSSVGSASSSSSSPRGSPTLVNDDPMIMMKMDESRESSMPQQQQILPTNDGGGSRWSRNLSLSRSPDSRVTIETVPATIINEPMQKVPGTITLAHRQDVVGALPSAVTSASSPLPPQFQPSQETQSGIAASQYRASASASHSSHQVGLEPPASSRPVVGVALSASEQEQEDRMELDLDFDLGDADREPDADDIAGGGGGHGGEEEDSDSASVKRILLDTQQRGEQQREDEDELEEEGEVEVGIEKRDNSRKNRNSHSLEHDHHNGEGDGDGDSNGHNNDARRHLYSNGDHQATIPVSSQANGSGTGDANGIGAIITTTKSSAGKEEGTTEGDEENMVRFLLRERDSWLAQKRKMQNSLLEALKEKDKALKRTEVVKTKSTQLLQQGLKRLEDANAKCEAFQAELQNALIARHGPFSGQNIKNQIQEMRTEIANALQKSGPWLDDQGNIFIEKLEDRKLSVLRDAEATQDRMQGVIDLLRETLNTKVGEISEARDRIAALEDALQNASNTTRDYEQLQNYFVGGLRSMKDEFLQQNAITIAERKQAHKELHERVQTCHSLSVEIHELKSSLERSENHNVELQKSKSDLETTSQQLHETIHCLRDETDQLKSQIQDVEVDRDNVSAELSQVKSACQGHSESILQLQQESVSIQVSKQDLAERFAIQCGQAEEQHKILLHTQSRLEESARALKEAHDRETGLLEKAHKSLNEYNVVVSKNVVLEEQTISLRGEAEASASKALLLEERLNGDSKQLQEQHTRSAKERNLLEDRLKDAESRRQQHEHQCSIMQESLVKLRSELASERDEHRRSTTELQQEVEMLKTRCAKSSKSLEELTTTLDLIREDAKKREESEKIRGEEARVKAIAHCEQKHARNLTDKENELHRCKNKLSDADRQAKKLRSELFKLRPKRAAGPNEPSPAIPTQDTDSPVLGVSDGTEQPSHELSLPGTPTTNDQPCSLSAAALMFQQQGDHEQTMDWHEDLPSTIAPTTRTKRRRDEMEDPFHSGQEVRAFKTAGKARRIARGGDKTSNKRTLTKSGELDVSVKEEDEDESNVIGGHALRKGRPAIPLAKHNENQNISKSARR